MRLRLGPLSESFSELYVTKTEHRWEVKKSMDNIPRVYEDKKEKKVIKVTYLPFIEQDCVYAEFLERAQDLRAVWKVYEKQLVRLEETQSTVENIKCWRWEKKQISRVIKASPRGLHEDPELDLLLRAYRCGVRLCRLCDTRSRNAITAGTNCADHGRPGVRTREMRNKRLDQVKNSEKKAFKPKACTMEQIAEKQRYVTGIVSLLEECECIIRELVPSVVFPDWRMKILGPLSQWKSSPTGKVWTGLQPQDILDNDFNECECITTIKFNAAIAALEKSNFHDHEAAVACVTALAKLKNSKSPKMASNAHREFEALPKEIQNLMDSSAEETVTGTGVLGEAIGGEPAATVSSLMQETVTDAELL
ncbi:hypothetical protein MMC21_002458 [Puttea exsequens]|nr:hypothetical protein [Puttea exsequens]